jgi:NhaP-type Na+/H+ or K+/H+ antiporter
MIPLAVFVSLLLFYSLVSRRLERTVFTAPIVFTAAGMLMVPALPAILRAGLNVEVFLRLAETGLVLLLFTDASRADLRVLRNIRNLPARLLSVGMLLTILLGAVAAWLVFPHISIWEAGILAAILAPTDAGLGQVIVNSPRVPLGIRQALNVEAGLNDGLSVPFLLFFIALAAAGIEGRNASLARFIVEQLGYGVLVGVGIGLIGGWLLDLARRKEWMAESFEKVGLVALPLLCMIVSEMVGASMFIAAFVAGIGAQIGFKDRSAHRLEFAEELGQILNLSVFFLFGLLVVRDWRRFDVASLLYAVLSLTAVRMLPVAIALIGTPERADGGIHGVVRPARAGLYRSRTGLSGTGNAFTRRVDDPDRRDDDRAAKHLRPWAERRARHRLLCAQDRGASRHRAGASRDRRRGVSIGDGLSSFGVQSTMDKSWG